MVAGRLGAVAAPVYRSGMARSVRQTTITRFLDCHGNFAYIVGVPSAALSDQLDRDGCEVDTWINEYAPDHRDHNELAAGRGEPVRIGRLNDEYVVYGRRAPRGVMHEFTVPMGKTNRQILEEADILPVRMDDARSEALPRLPDGISRKAYQAKLDSIILRHDVKDLLALPRVREALADELHQEVIDELEGRAYRPPQQVEVIRRHSFTTEIAPGNTVLRPKADLRGETVGVLIDYGPARNEEGVTRARYKVTGYRYPVLAWFDNRTGRRVA